LAGLSFRFQRARSLALPSSASPPDHLFIYRESFRRLKEAPDLIRRHRVQWFPGCGAITRGDGVGKSGMSSARHAWMALLGLAFPLAPTPASAQPVDIPLTWGGDFWTRPRLTGSWDGL